MSGCAHTRGCMAGFPSTGKPPRTRCLPIRRQRQWTRAASQDRARSRRCCRRSNAFRDTFRPPPPQAPPPTRLPPADEEAIITGANRADTDLRLSPPPARREVSFWDRLGALARGYESGGLLGGIADAGNSVDRNIDTENRTVQALVANGMNSDLATVIARNPALL